MPCSAADVAAAEGPAGANAGTLKLRQRGGVKVSGSMLPKSYSFCPFLAKQSLFVTVDDQLWAVERCVRTRRPDGKSMPHVAHIGPLKKATNIPRCWLQSLPSRRAGGEKAWPEC